MLQEIIARSLGVDVGPYKHLVGNLHLYQQNHTKAKQYIDEGWQSTLKPMTAMPEEDPWNSIDELLVLEERIRRGEHSAQTSKPLAGYWNDVINLLKVYSLFKSEDFEGIQRIKSNFSTKVFDEVVNDKLNILRERFDAR
jgi:thymidylate synthase